MAQLFLSPNSLASWQFLTKKCKYVLDTSSAQRDALRSGMALALGAALQRETGTLAMEQSTDSQLPGSMACRQKH